MNMPITFVTINDRDADEHNTREMTVPTSFKQFVDSRNAEVKREMAEINAIVEPAVKGMANVRISTETKDIIAYRVASEWLEFARRILSEGGRPARLQDTVTGSVWAKLVDRYGEEGADTISTRTRDEIASRANYHARVLHLAGI